MCSVPVGGCEAEEPDSSPADQTVHRTPTSSRPLLSDGAQLQTQVRTEEGKKMFLFILWFSTFPFSLQNSFLNVFFVLAGVVVCRQDIGASSQRRRRLQPAEHADPRWVQTPCSAAVRLWRALQAGLNTIRAFEIRRVLLHLNATMLKTVVCQQEFWEM